MNNDKTFQQQIESELDRVNNLPQNFATEPNKTPLGTNLHFTAYEEIIEDKKLDGLSEEEYRQYLLNKLQPDEQRMNNARWEQDKYQIENFRQEL